MAYIGNLNIPYEVWEHIFSYVTTKDIINFCNASNNYKHFLREKNIVKTFDISGDYALCHIDLYAYIKENVSYEFIKTLNISKLYWISLDYLRRLVKGLPNLEELLALNTKLSLRAKDVLLYKKLKTLAVSIEGSHFLTSVDPLIYRNNLYLLRKLCVHISVKHHKAFPGMCKLFNELFAVQELWICDTDDSQPIPIRFDALVVHMKFLNKLVIKSRVNIAFLDYRAFNLAKYFETRRFRAIAMKYERFPPDQIIPFKDVTLCEKTGSSLEEAWFILHAYRSEMPYDPDVHREVYLTKQIEHCQFKSLNFFHNKCFCTKDYITATELFLKSENSRQLEKLSVKSCILQRRFVSKLGGIERLARVYAISEIIENCQKLRVLEMRQCSSCNITILEGYRFLPKWIYLEKLTIEIPAHLDGKFLFELVEECKNLKVLRILSYNTNENLNRNVYRAISNANALEDFCLQNKYMNIPVLFSKLRHLTSGKLRRIYISCEDTESNNVDDIEGFLRSNPQLIFLYIIIKDKSRNYIHRLQELMNKFNDNHPAKRFYARKDSGLFHGNFPIPEVHRELFSFDSEISTVDIYDFK